MIVCSSRSRHIILKLISWSSLNMGWNPILCLIHLWRKSKPLFFLKEKDFHRCSFPSLFLVNLSICVEQMPWWIYKFIVCLILIRSFKDNFRFLRVHLLLSLLHINISRQVIILIVSLFSAILYVFNPANTFFSPYS